MARIHTPVGAVVVGVDGSADSRAALTWAIGESVRRGLALHLVHVASDRSRTPIGAAAREDRVIGPEMRNALDELRAFEPRLRPSWSEVGGSPVSALIDASGVAEEIVLGSGRAGSARSSALGSVAVGVAMRAQCPVVLVRDGIGARPASAPVVVGLGDGPAHHLEPLLKFAFEDAARRAVDLVAVRAWELDLVGYAYRLPVVLVDRGDGVLHDRERMDRVLAGWSERYPAVTVRQKEVLSRAVDALVRESRTARVLVIGSPTRSESGGALLGSMAQAVMQRACCPVVVVRPAMEAAH